LHYKPEDHDWCLSEHPPVLNACSAEEIAAAMERLITRPDDAAEIGRRSREWFLSHHSLDLVVERHMQIYDAIKGHPAVVQVPKEYAVKKDMHVSTPRANVVAIVRCANPLDDSGRPRYLREIGGVPQIDVLADRLRRTPHIKRVVMILDRPEPETTAAARRLGWGVLVKSKRRWEDLRTLMSLATCKRVAAFNLERPFVDPETMGLLLDQADQNRLSMLHVVEGKDFVPALTLTRNFIVKVLLFRLLMRGNLDWRLAANTLAPLVMHWDYRRGVTDIARLLATDDGRMALIDMLGGPAFSLELLQDRMEEPGFDHDVVLAKRDYLHREMRRAAQPSAKPAAFNERLNDIERQLGREELSAFPTLVGLNMTSTCNAHCVFCSYQPSMLKNRDAVTLDDMKKMTWLKYVKEFAIWGGIGDSLVNPQFLDCYRYLKTTFPHLAVTCYTNGIRLSREICDEFAGSLAQLNVSLNAARKETWKKLMRSKGFDNICEQYAYLSQRRRELGVKNPSLALSMVLTRDNVEETVEFAELAHRLGADTVTFVHYVSSTLVGSRDLHKEGSLYYEKQKADAWLDRAACRCYELGLQINRPLPFAAESTQIQYGARIQHDPPPCHDPWKSCYLTVDEEGQRQMIFCCSGFYYGVKYDKSDLSEEKFREIWNHPIARYFRRTANKKGANSICAYCQSVDRFDPANNPLYYKIGKEAATMFQSSESKVIHFRMKGDFSGAPPRCAAKS
jgi:MoaA/NifB/PqqE/SkfB family radical SAM enzyme